MKIGDQENKVLLLALLIMITIFVYYPGLTGGYLLDDSHQLQNLELINDNLTFKSSLAYLGSSDSGPLKRPISIFSFLLDSTHWPTNPESFLRTNLIIHLLNGILLFILLVKIFQYIEFLNKQRYDIAFLATGFWLLHPFFVSSVLYIVQRMAMLPATFVLLGLLIYFHGRILYNKSVNDKKSITLMFLGVYLFSLLASLAKENGILLILLIALFENLICLKALKLNPLNRKIKLWIIQIPSFILLLLIAYNFISHLRFYEYREFSLYERLLSETRATCKYLYHLVVPNYFTEGVYTDGFKKSIGLFEPITTIFSVIMICSLLIWSYLQRNINPIFTFAILFYFIASLLESTFLPLELYFEHRNYLSALFIFIPLAILLVRLRNKKIYYLLIVSIFALLGVTTHTRTSLWGNELQLKTQTALKFPESSRATVEAATINMTRGHLQVSEDLVVKAIKRINTIELSSHYISFLCVLKRLDKSRVDDFLIRLKNEKIIQTDLKPLRFLVRKFMYGDCLGKFSQKYAEKLITAFTTNIYGHKGIALETKYSFLSEHYFNQGKIKKSLDAYRKLFSLDNNYYFTMGITAKYHANKNLIEANTLYSDMLKSYNDRKFYKVDWLNVGANLQSLGLFLKQNQENNNENINNNSR